MDVSCCCSKVLLVCCSDSSCRSLAGFICGGSRVKRRQGEPGRQQVLVEYVCQASADVLEKDAQLLLFLAVTGVLVWQQLPELG